MEYLLKNNICLQPCPQILVVGPSTCVEGTKTRQCQISGCEHIALTTVLILRVVVINLVMSQGVEFP